MKPRSKLIAAARAVILAGITLGVSAQTAVAAEASPAKTADQQWEAMRNFGRASATAVGQQPQGPSMSRADRVVASVVQADQLKNFYTQFPAHASAKEAKRLEALALSQAAINGETMYDVRRKTLLDEVRKDASLPAQKRYEAVAWDRQVSVSRQVLATHNARMAAQEEISRALVTEFPGVSDGYDSLLAVARDSDPARGRVVIADLRRMALPPKVAGETVLLAERLALIGKRVAEILGRAGAPALVAATKNRPAVFYTWVPGDRRSITTAKRLAKLAPSAVLIGVCLATDPATAWAAAQKEKLPGEQYIDTRGPASPLALTLMFNRSTQVYLVDRTGQIADVNGLVDTGEKLTRIIR